MESIPRKKTERSLNLFVDRRGYLAELFVCEGNSSGNCGVRRKKKKILVGSECNANVYGTTGLFMS